MNIYRTLHPGLGTKVKVPIPHSPLSLFLSTSLSVMTVLITSTEVFIPRYITNTIYISPFKNKVKEKKKLKYQGKKDHCCREVVQCVIFILHIKA